MRRKRPAGAGYAASHIAPATPKRKRYGAAPGIVDLVRLAFGTSLALQWRYARFQS
jgi:hypothetical protein